VEGSGWRLVESVSGEGQENVEDLKIVIEGYRRV
jgi:hypothetical protein